MDSSSKNPEIGFYWVWLACLWSSANSWPNTLAKRIRSALWYRPVRWLCSNKTIYQKLLGQIWSARRSLPSPELQYSSSLKWCTRESLIYYYYYYYYYHCYYWMLYRGNRVMWRLCLPSFVLKPNSLTFLPVGNHFSYFLLYSLSILYAKASTYAFLFFHPFHMLDTLFSILIILSKYLSSRSFHNQFIENTFIPFYSCMIFHRMDVTY